MVCFLAPRRLFNKCMSEMGFTCDSDTTSSNVRFYPPSITLEKVEPEPTEIQPDMLQDFAKKLGETYGWDEAEFLSLLKDLENRERDSKPSPLAPSGQTPTRVHDGRTNKKAKHSLFSRLSKKSTNSMHQLLRTYEDETKSLAPMKWETFLKLMREMGFTYDPSTAGASVRFKPSGLEGCAHPDPIIHPIMLREFAKKLNKTYGWS
ncbi:hypothetical protein C8F01DRAFT_1102376 [Mycena amicta]|nr:hypothetical protein C8F01DRAFT_1102376 [Mycena amicta]